MLVDVKMEKHASISTLRKYVRLIVKKAHANLLLPVNSDIQEGFVMNTKGKESVKEERLVNSDILIKPTALLF